MKYLPLCLLLLALWVVVGEAPKTKKSCDELKSEYDDYCDQNAPGAAVHPQDDVFAAFSSCGEAQANLCSSNKDHHAGCCTDNECKNIYLDWINQCVLAEKFGLDCACPKILSTSTETKSRGLDAETGDDEASRSFLSDLITMIMSTFESVLCTITFGLVCPPPPPSLPPSLGDPLCNEDEDGAIICIGRPFRDDQNQIVEASAQICDASSNPSWSNDHRVILDVDDKIITKTADADSTERANEWTRRAIGEHASIASFASFVINLMTNQAPPHLIRQALAAAQDELDHATISFTVASLLLGDGTNSEPGPLPSTAVSFTTNLTALGIATVREGCKFF